MQRLEIPRLLYHFLKHASPEHSIAVKFSSTGTCIETRRPHEMKQQAHPVRRVVACFLLRAGRESCAKSHVEPEAKEEEAKRAAKEAGRWCPRS